MSTQTKDRVRTVEAADVPARWQERLEEVERTGRRLVLVEDGRTVGALISRYDIQRLQKLEAAWREEFDELREEMVATFADVPPDEHEREIERAIAEVRAERRQRATAAANAGERIGRPPSRR